MDKLKYEVLEISWKYMIIYRWSVETFAYS